MNNCGELQRTTYGKAFKVSHIKRVLVVRTEIFAEVEQPKGMSAPVKAFPCFLHTP